jgi:hypothetical protein
MGESWEAVNKLLSPDIEALNQAAKVSAGEEVVALKKALASKVLAEEEVVFHQRRPNEAVVIMLAGIFTSLI